MNHFLKLIQSGATAEIAAAVVWLCLDAPPYMTAERLNMSGGMDKD